MAKRVRGSTRPGQRARLQRSGPARPRVPDRPTTPTPPSSALTEAEEARAAELEAQILAAERALEPATSRTRPRQSPPPATESRVRPGSIGIRAAEEYAYVSRDVRKIVVIGGFLLALLFAIWAVVQATGLGPF